MHIYVTKNSRKNGCNILHLLQFKQIYYKTTLNKKKEPPSIAAKKLMVTKYNTKGQGIDESIFNS
mgnify:CR=1 FL=1